MNLILKPIRTPAHLPKPRGKSPGWEEGKQRQRRIRYPVVKKTTSKSRKEQKNRLSIKDFLAYQLCFMNSVLMATGKCNKIPTIILDVEMSKPTL